MDPINIIQSRTVLMPAKDIDTDQIIPARFLTTTTKEGLGEVVFNDLRRDASGNDIDTFILNQPQSAGCRILVGGNNFGCGSSREHAPWALLDYGFQAVISSEIADIFKSNSLKNGLLPIVIDADTHADLLSKPGVSVTIDLEAQTLAIEDGKTVKFPIDSFARYCLLNGVDQLGYVLQQSAAIDAYEENRTWTP
jgi:3-isopropylmalate/(R)-2-methylmalate dehydratase small subunit